MKKENSCYTYFQITGNDFPLEEITELLGAKPFRSWYKTDIRKADGNQYGFCNWSGFRCDEYCPYVEQQMEKTIEPLFEKIDTLKLISKAYDVEFSLVVVPEIYVNKINPDLSPSMKVIDFCHETRTKISIDLYLYK